MNFGELYLRALVAGACVGLPGYIIGQLIYNGRRVRPAALAAVGAVSGLTFGLIALSSLALPWVPVVALSVLASLLMAALFLALPAAQNRLRGR